MRTFLQSKAVNGTRVFVHWSLIVVTIVYLVTGFGITEFRIVEPATFGLLTKPLAFKLHTKLHYPFIALLVLHLFFVLVVKPYCKIKNRESDSA
jgi:cytochrome b subunit of formate dehydrogenase